MKPVVTWIVLADTREARVLANAGPGKGLKKLDGKSWKSEKADLPRDKAGVGHSIAGPAVSAVDAGDHQRHIDAQFAKDIAHRLAQSLDAKQFDRLVLVAGPLMLGLLRASINDRLKGVIVDEIDKDLSDLPMRALESHLGEVIAV